MGERYGAAACTGCEKLLVAPCAGGGAWAKCLATGRVLEHVRRAEQAGGMALWRPAWCYGHGGIGIDMDKVCLGRRPK